MEDQVNAFSGLQQLKRLTLTRCTEDPRRRPLRPSHFLPVLSLTGLEELVLGGPDISNSLARSIGSSLKQLRALEIHRSPRLGASGLVGWSSLGKLTRLGIYHCPRVGDNSASWGTGSLYSLRVSVQGRRLTREGGRGRVSARGRHGVPTLMMGLEPLPAHASCWKAGKGRGLPCAPSWVDCLPPAGCPRGLTDCRADGCR